VTSQVLSRRRFLLQSAGVLAAASPLLRLAAQAEPALAAAAGRTCAIGAYVNPANRQLTFAESQQAISRLESRLAHPLRIVGTYVGWEEPFPNDGHRSDREHGRVPLVAWDAPADLGAVAAGRWDALLRERARACREFGAPISLRWGAEFNGAWNSAYGRGPAFARAWRHIVGVFRRTGATNASWVWCPFAVDAIRVRADDWHAYYPGDRFVDVVGMDGFNWGATRSWSRWQSFATIFGPLHDDFVHRKPTMICEVGCAEAGGDKAEWIAEMGRQLAGRFSHVHALVWFDANKETDWRIDSSPRALEAMRAVVRRPRYT
jgi:hypothetical protein